MTNSTRRAIVGSIIASPALSEARTLGGRTESSRNTLRNHAINIEEFGGKADWNGSTGTDNYAPMMAALALHGYRPGTGESTYLPIIKFGVGAYYFSKTIEILDNVVHFLGAGVQTNGTLFVFPADTLGIQLNSSNTIGNTTRKGSGRGAMDSIIENIALLSQGGTDKSKHGIRLRVKAHLRNVGCVNFPGNAFHIAASAGRGANEEGNCNDWKMEYCYVNGAGLHGLYVDGMDSNGATCIHFQTHGAIHGCGICEFSALSSNVYIGCQVTGFGNTGVTRKGKHYILIKTNVGDTLGGTTEPGTDHNDIWYCLGSGMVTSQYPEWVQRTTYYLNRPYYASGANTVFVNPYSEGGALSHGWGGALFISGVLECTNWTNHIHTASPNVSELYNRRAIGSRKSFYPGQPGYDNNGPAIWAALGGAPDGSSTFDKGMAVFSHGRASDQAGTDFPWNYGYSREFGPDLYYKYLNAPMTWRVTTRATTTSFGRSAPVPYTFCVFDHAICDPHNTNQERIHGIRDAPPSGGPHARGEFYWNVNPSVDGNGMILLGWSCTASGDPGTFAPVYVKTTALT
jgi:hypothetical protein